MLHVPHHCTFFFAILKLQVSRRNPVLLRQGPSFVICTSGVCISLSHTVSHNERKCQMRTTVKSVRFHVLTTASMKMSSEILHRVVWTDVYRRFGGVYCLHHQGDYTAQRPRRKSSSQTKFVFWHRVTVFHWTGWDIIPYTSAATSDQRVENPWFSYLDFMKLSGVAKWLVCTGPVAITQVPEMRYGSGWGEHEGYSTASKLH
jgi:hypothetical protein